MAHNTSSFVITEQPAPETEGKTVLTIALEASPISVEARTIHALLPQYFEACRRTGVSAAAIHNYRKDLKNFLNWWEITAPLHCHTFTPAALQEYGEYVSQATHKGQPYKKGTVDTYIRRTRQFLRWIYKSGRLPIDISQWVPMPPHPPASTRKLEPHEMTLLFSTCHGVNRMRNMALLAFMLESGARRMETAALLWENVYFDGWKGRAYLAVAKRYMRDDRARTVVFGEVAGKLMQMWAVISGSSADGRVFRISASGITQVMDSLSRTSHVAFSPHDLRRTFAHHWIRHCEAPNKDVAERLLEVQLGHNPRTVTQRHYMALTHMDVAQHYCTPLSLVSLPGLNRPNGTLSP